MASEPSRLETTGQAGHSTKGEPKPRHPVPVGIDAPIFEVMASMRSMRRLRPDPVPEELLNQIIGAATWAPSASHLQRFSFVLVTDRKQIERLAGIWQAVVAFYGETFLRVLPSDLPPDQTRRTVDAIEYQAAHFAETPAVIVACYDFGSWIGSVQKRMLGAPGAFRRFGGRRTLALIRNTGNLGRRSEAASIYPAVQNLLLAAVSRSGRQPFDVAPDGRRRGQTGAGHPPRRSHLRHHPGRLADGHLRAGTPASRRLRDPPGPLVTPVNPRHCLPTPTLSAKRPANRPNG